MPKYYPNNRFSDCYASVGNITFYHKDGECYYRTKAKPVFPGTSGQQEQLSLHRRAIAAWRKQEHDIQLKWNELAKGVLSKRPPFNHSTHISGYNLFVSAYHGLASVGRESIPSPMPVPDFPEIHLEYSSFATVDNTDLTLTFKVQTDYILSDKFQLMGKLQLGLPGYKPHTGKYRNYIATIVNDNDNLNLKAVFTISNYIDMGIDIAQSSIHLQYFLIDIRTGYRTKQKYLTSIVRG